MWSGPQGILDKMQLLHFSYSYLPLFSLTVFSKNDLLFGSKIQILCPVSLSWLPHFPSGWILCIGCPSGMLVKAMHMNSAWALERTITIKQKQEIKPKPKGLVPCQEHLAKQMENSKNWFRNRLRPALAFKPSIEASNLAQESGVLRSPVDWHSIQHLKKKRKEKKKTRCEEIHKPLGARRKLSKNSFQEHQLPSLWDLRSWKA